MCPVGSLFNLHPREEENCHVQTNACLFTQRDGRLRDAANSGASGGTGEGANCEGRSGQQIGADLAELPETPRARPPARKRMATSQGPVADRRRGGAEVGGRG